MGKNDGPLRVKNEMGATMDLLYVLALCTYRYPEWPEMLCVVYVTLFHHLPRTTSYRIMQSDVDELKFKLWDKLQYHVNDLYCARQSFVNVASWTNPGPLY